MTDLTTFCPGLVPEDHGSHRMFRLAEHGTALANIEYGTLLYRNRGIKSLLVKEDDTTYVVYVSIPDAIKMEFLPEGTT